MSPGLRVGVFGGTFDPPHLGHAIVAARAAAALMLDRVLWVPANRPPHKSGRRVTPGPLRRLMVEAAVASDSRFELCSLELDRGGVSYTVDTLRRLRADHPDWKLTLILGADLVAGLPGWREAAEIARLADVAAVTRGARGAAEADVARAGALPMRIRSLAAATPDISSSEVRRRLRAGATELGMVQPPVMAVIDREGLYRAASSRPRPGPRERSAATHWGGRQ